MAIRKNGFLRRIKINGYMMLITHRYGSKINIKTDVILCKLFSSSENNRA